MNFYRIANSPITFKNYAPVVLLSLFISSIELADLNLIYEATTLF